MTDQSNPFEECETPIDIPRLFQPFLEEGYFEECIICGRSLLEPDVRYHIEKGIKGSEVIFEYAMCSNCTQDVCDELSKESMMRIAEYFQGKQSRIMLRLSRLANEDPDVDTWLSECILSGMPRAELETCQIYGQCRGDKLLMGFYPFMIGSPVMEEVSKLLSKKTQDALDDFTDNYLNMPPEYRDLFDDTPLLIM